MKACYLIVMGFRHFGPIVKISRRRPTLLPAHSQVLVAGSSIELPHERSSSERIRPLAHSLSRNFYESLLLNCSPPAHSRQLMAAISAVHLVRQVCLVGRLHITVSFIPLSEIQHGHIPCLCTIFAIRHCVSFPDQGRNFQWISLFLLKPFFLLIRGDTIQAEPIEGACYYPHKKGIKLPSFIPLMTPITVASIMD